MASKSSEGEVKMLESESNSQGFRAVRWKSSQTQDMQPQIIKKQGSNNWCCNNISSDTSVRCFPNRVVQGSLCKERIAPSSHSTEIPESISCHFSSSSPASQEGGKAFKSTQKDGLLRYWEALKSFYLFRTITKKIHTGPFQIGQREYIICSCLSDIYLKKKK